MASKGESGWQSEKTLTECMRYMLDNEIATDVCFEVGAPDGAITKIQAHKYMLISRSAVFEVMFSSGMTESRIERNTTIIMDDIDANIFKDILLYIYCEDISVNVETAASLMYAANKYMLPKLVRECGKCLSEGLDVNNVIPVLEQSLLFDDSELKNKCIDLIYENAHTVLTGTEILSASPQTMETILQMDRILVKEIVLYETCLAWAKRQFQIQSSTENPTDKQIKEILGDLLYKIRFPTMEMTEFAEISEGKNVLTGEEKASVYYFLTTKNKGSQVLFPTERRLSEEVWIERALTCLTGGWYTTPGGWYAPPGIDAINFKTDQDIVLTGICLYTGHNGAGYDVDVEVLNPTNSLFKKKLTVPSTGDANQFKVSIAVPIFIKAEIIYSVKTFRNGQIGHFGRPSQAVCTKENVTFTFSKYPESPYTNEVDGQIPRLYFCY